MLGEELYNLANEKFDDFNEYITNVKKRVKADIYSITHPTIVKNPYATIFPKNYFLEKNITQSNIRIFLSSMIRFYKNAFVRLMIHILHIICFKIYYKKPVKISKNIIDTYNVAENNIAADKYTENYLVGIYELFDKYNTDYCVIPRIYYKSGFKISTMIKNCKILNSSNENFIFDFSFFSFFDFIYYIWFCAFYPFMSLRLLQKKAETNIDKIFNKSVLFDTRNFNYDAIFRYIFARKLAKYTQIEHVYSWSEFQVNERSFNYGIRKNNDKIKLHALQFFIPYKFYFNVVVDDIDYDMLSSAHDIYVNGKHYLQNRKKLIYKNGVSLRYKNIFDFSGVEKSRYITLLGSYVVEDTQLCIDALKNFKEVIFKSHPAVNITRLGIPSHFVVENKNMYELFKTAKIIITAGSGAALEAVACGILVVLIGSNDFTMNPLCDYGKGKIWDIVFDADELPQTIENLLKYNQENKDEVAKIAKWYKENFFIESNEENIKKVFSIS